MRKPIIGVMGPGYGATETDIKNAFELGALIAQNGWNLLSGGRNAGVMDAVNKGAKSVGGLTIGIIPIKDNSYTSEAVDITIITGMGSARNNISILSSDVVIACGMGAGTASEVSLALKSQKQVILLTDDENGKKFFLNLDKDRVQIANSPAEVIERVKKLLANS